MKGLRLRYNMMPARTAAEIKKLWIDGLTGAVIADRLKITRSAVMGKINRLVAAGEVERRPRKKKEEFKLVSPHRSQNRKPPQRKLNGSRVVTPIIPPETWPNGTGCQFMTGDPAKPGWTFCGRPSVKARWCEGHTAVVFQP